MNRIEEIKKVLRRYHGWSENVYEIDAQQISDLFEFPLEDLRSEITDFITKYKDAAERNALAETPAESANYIIKLVSAYLSAKKLVELAEDQSHPSVPTCAPRGFELSTDVFQMGYRLAQHDDEVAGFKKVQEEISLEIKKAPRAEDDGLFIVNVYANNNSILQLWCDHISKWGDDSYTFNLKGQNICGISAKKVKFEEELKGFDWKPSR